MNDLMIELLLALSLLTGYKVPAPEVRILMPAELSLLACKGGCSPKGAYIDGVVYLSNQVDLAGPVGRAALFHELVHHGQAARKGVAKDCHEWLVRETEAYAAQNRYLSEIESVASRVYFSGRCVEKKTSD